MKMDGGCLRNRAHLGETRGKDALSPQRCHGTLCFARKTGHKRAKARHIYAAGDATIINKQWPGGEVAACINISSGGGGAYFLFGTLVVSCGGIPAGTVVMLYAVCSTAVPPVVRKAVNE